MNSKLSKNENLSEYLNVKPALTLLTGTLSLLFVLSVSISCKPPEVDFDQKRKLLRAYSGAPPVIPHVIDRRTSRETCLHCHTKGGNYFEGKRGKPTPHPEYINCWQCHVEQLSNDFFVKNNFQPNRYQRYKRVDLEVPPFRPHPLQNREKCEVCHLSKNADPDLVPSHGPREGCPMCHTEKTDDDEDDEDDDVNETNDSEADKE